ncbi:hypothetical protein [Lysinibacillus mangiferihumi]|uniref:hypothetical protein n=1 Tax=Lysinibacillus mangiferihumi TaxID=1130819 RepID=UPI00142E752C|nr:hypothetical protein [Lysinibacillus mangiferihumi]
MSSWGSSIVNAAKKTAKNQIWPAAIGTSVITGAGAGIGKGIYTDTQNKVYKHINNI